MLCGGVISKNQYYCRQWNSKEGKFSKEPVHEFRPSRYRLVSWTPASEKETFLIGGGSSITAGSTSTVVKPGISEGNYGFNLTHTIFGACAIPDPDTDTVLITGGNTDTPKYRITSLYNDDGWVEDFGFLNYERRFHGCTSYIADKKRVLYKIFYTKSIDYLGTSL